MYLRYSTRKSFFRTYGIIFGLAITAFVVRYFKFSEYGLSFHFGVFLVSLITTAASWESLRGINDYLDKVMPFEASIPKRMATQLLAGSVVALLIRFLLFKAATPLIPFKLDSLFLASTWIIYIFLCALINLGFFTHYLIIRWKASLILAGKLEKEKMQVQFDNLRNQLNPHFLFNALTSLNSLIFEDQKLASRFLLQLSKVYRYVLQNKDRTVVTLETELDFIGHFISLLQTRFGSALSIRFDIPQLFHEHGIVPVTLQILIENAIKHNIVDAQKPLVITIAVEGDYLEVRNNLQKREVVEESNKQGLDNLRTLYGYLTEKPVLVKNTGDEFAVGVPLL